MKTRSREKELIDLGTLTREELEGTYRFLTHLNKLGGGRAIRNELRRLSKSWTGPVRILDVGSGGADIARLVARWARAAGREVAITCCDVSPVAQAFARRECAGFPSISFVRADARTLPFAPASFDYVICSLFLHHLADDDAVTMLRAFDRLASRGLVLCDAIRRRRAWLWVSFLTLFGNRAVRYDGPLSVKRAFTIPEIEAVAARAGLSWTRVRPVFGHHFLLSGERPSVCLQSSR
jgi:ubiquinone/menaquinone biosynthesis C-methylase UbiE